MSAVSVFGADLTAAAAAEYLAIVGGFAADMPPTWRVTINVEFAAVAPADTGEQVAS